jgi:heterodisulfide reductase subunit B
MNYLYFPGCALRTSSKPYDQSILAVFKALGVSLTELEDWNCCGATTYMSIDEKKAFALAGRNLALAEMQGKEGGADPQLVAPCSACYQVLTKTQHYLETYPDLGKTVKAALTEVGLPYTGRVRVRHPLDILVNDVGLPAITAAVKRPLKGVKVASYYGCQIVRPFALFDDQRDPQTMDRLVKAIGAEPIDWPLKTRCCGGALINTVHEAGVNLSYRIIRDAQKRGADIMLTACPLCQFNLECFQGEMNKKFNDTIEMPIIYFTQLLGMALGIPDRELGIDRSFINPSRVAKLRIGKEPAYA